MVERGPVRFGRYELMQQLSAGRMAEVFVGRVAGAAGVEKRLAIKRILDDYCEDEEFVQAFIREAKISTSLTHPNVGQVYEFGEVDGQYYLAMELVHGRDLAAVLDHFRALSQPMPVPVAIRIVLEVCKALDYAHNKLDPAGNPLELVHRDISPPNILISFEGAVKLIDFGIARALASHHETATGPLKAKCAYVSPEQALGQPIDRRSDLFALGSVFFEMVTGQPLFQGDNDMATLNKLRRAEVPRPSLLNAKLPARLEAVLFKMLAREPERRYQAADTLHDLLERIAIDESLSLSTLQLARWMTGTFPVEQQPISVLQSEELTVPAEGELGSDGDTQPGPSTAEFLLSLTGNSRLASAAAFEAGRPAVEEKNYDFTALDFTPPGASAPPPADPDLPIITAARAAATDVDPLDMTRPKVKVAELADDSCNQYLVEKPFEKSSEKPIWDEEPTSPMHDAEWDPVTIRKASQLRRSETRELVSRDSGQAAPDERVLPPASGGVSFQVGPIEDEGTSACDPESIDPIATTLEFERYRGKDETGEAGDPADTVVEDLPEPPPAKGGSGR